MDLWFLAFCISQADNQFAKHCNEGLLILCIGTPPLTPLANLKVLIAAASTAREKESGKGGDGVGLVEVKCDEEKGCKEPEEGGGRKMRSLAILCKKLVKEW